MFAILAEGVPTRRMIRPHGQSSSMSTLHRIQAVSVRYNASQWLCVIVGAYFAMQIVSPGALLG